MGFLGSRDARTCSRLRRPGLLGFRLLAVREPVHTTQMNATPDDAVDSSGIGISNHARLRCMQRLGVVERAAEHIRDLLATAEPVDVDYVKNAKAYRAGGVVLVVSGDGETVETVLRREVEG